MEALFSDYEAIRKSGLFDPEHYIKAYPDVAERNVDPLVHYLEEGARERRDPHPGFRVGFVGVNALMILYLAMMFITKRRQSVHDLVAGTVVVNAG